ncbi:von Willebrand factor type A domain [Carpediemonas membranifera]|uniref:von Willebrand factor type A domain n=1 Tax=Carpediemonas membranifera TaxID=201153 RepID=A0A8J6ARS4_9EUKA|nr:von Willebrand factor type A domain [Carpediemonas membranifera]|eukprot:KAG9390605.1 von Willebrand factor type A domain [Carpediemonas membranifera]
MSVTPTTSLIADYSAINYQDKMQINVLGSIVVPESQMYDEEDDRPPIDIVTVVDVSGSMGGERIDLLRLSLKFLVSEMRPQDRIAIISFCSHVETVFELSAVQDKARINALIDNRINATSCTALAPALYQGIVTLRHRVNANPVGSLVLLTDGFANEGDSEASVICGRVKQLLSGDKHVFDATAPHIDRIAAAPSWNNVQPGSKVAKGGLFGGLLGKKKKKNHHPAPQQQQQQQMQLPSAPLVCGSDGVDMANVDTRMLLEMMDRPGQPMSITTIGLGSSHDQAMLSAIAEGAAGMYYPITANAQVADVFGEILGGLVSAFMDRTKVTLTLAPGVTVPAESVFTGGQVTAGPGVIEFTLPTDISLGERRDIPFTAEVPALLGPDERWTAMTMTVSYFDIKAKAEATIPPVSLEIERGGTSTREESDLLAQNIIRRDVVLVMKQAREVARSSPEKARELLEGLLTRVKASTIPVYVKDGFISDLDQALASLLVSVAAMDQYAMGSAWSHQVQRGNAAMKSEAMYANVARVQTKMKSKKFMMR